MSYLITTNRAGATPQNAPYLLDIHRDIGGRREHTKLPCHVLSVAPSGNLQVMYFEIALTLPIPGVAAGGNFKIRYVPPHRVTPKDYIHGTF